MSRLWIFLRPSSVFLILCAATVVLLVVWPDTIIFSTPTVPIFIVLFLLATTVLAFWGLRRADHRLRRVIKSANAIMRGDYTLRLDEGGDDPISQVSAAINRLSRHIHATIYQLKSSETQIRRIAYQDSLTGLPNRRMFQYLLDRELARARREKSGLAIAVLDLDNLKDVNDSLGHECGDLLLEELSRRLLRRLRASEVVARLGGDEFALILRSPDGEGEAEATLRRVLAFCREPFELDAKEVLTSVSIGVCFFPQDGQAPRQLIRNADFALYEAKQEGRNNLRIFDRSMNRVASDRLRLEQKLRKAVDRAEFCLAWQPQVSLVNGRVTGMEALVRWNHAEDGMIMPDAFISIAEETGLMPKIGYQVLLDACREAVHWQSLGAPGIPISVNISVRQLQTGDLADEVEEVLELTGLNPFLLKLELTESIAAEGESVLRQLSSLRELGVGLVIDDFGTGYSSFNHILKYRIDTIKIDKSFVAGIPGNHERVILIKAILSVARNLQLAVVAEGVETRQQRDLLRSWGCEVGQGYLFMKPTPAEELDEVMSTGWIITPDDSDSAPRSEAKSPSRSA